MGEIYVSDSYDETRDPTKVCIFCGNPIEQSGGIKTFGMCERHSQVWSEDVGSRFERNRLKELIVKSKNK